MSNHTSLWGVWTSATRQALEAQGQTVDGEILNAINDQVSRCADLLREKQADSNFLSVQDAMTTLINEKGQLGKMGDILLWSFDEACLQNKLDTVNFRRPEPDDGASFSIRILPDSSIPKIYAA